MSNSTKNIRNSLGKIYLSLIMGVLMGIVEVLMNDYYMEMISISYYVPLFTVLFVLIFIYKKQMYIGDKNYLNEMIEHHSMALLTSEEIFKKTNDKNIKLLAANIINTQEKEIAIMKQMVERR